MDPAVQAAFVSTAGNIGGGLLSGGGNTDEHRFQKKMAQKSIRWRVQDAKAAGLHPLAALGMSPASGIPSQQVGDKYGLAQSGQDISKAIMSRKSPEAKEAITVALANEKLRGQKTQAEIDLINARIAEMNTPGTSTPEPTPTSPPGLLPGQVDQKQGNPGTVLTPNPQFYIKSPGLATGTNPAEQHIMIKDELVRMPTQATSEQISEDIYSKGIYLSNKGGQLLRTYYNYLKSALSKKKGAGLNAFYNEMRRERSKLPKVKFKIWQLDPAKNTWRMVDNTSTNRRSFWFKRPFSYSNEPY